MLDLLIELFNTQINTIDAKKECNIMDNKEFTEYVKKGYKLIDPDYLAELEEWKSVAQALFVTFILFVILLYINL